MIGLFQRQETDEFPAVFAVVERLHLEGEHFLQEAATIGFLEGLQNISEHNGLNPEVFVPFLHPETAKWWRHLDNFWAGKTQYVGGPLKEQNNEHSGN